MDFDAKQIRGQEDAQTLDSTSLDAGSPSRLCTHLSPLDSPHLSSLLTLRPELLTLIALHLLTTPPNLGSPAGLLPLLRTCRALPAHLGFGGNPALWADWAREVRQLHFGRSTCPLNCSLRTNHRTGDLSAYQDHRTTSSRSPTTPTPAPPPSRASSPAPLPPSPGSTTPTSSEFKRRVSAVASGLVAYRLVLREHWRMSPLSLSFDKTIPKLRGDVKGASYYPSLPVFAARADTPHPRTQT
ncbi:hypothetical protein B0H17DRAFT_1206000 [Mycena rosella]|uniref:Uncharacterized protein n=1 Tax=Mycena rosella TaxID=1033263 RepID=A0AAD7D9K8_MYCRO|nr:hypothetical protein B0H17DRAFT_1206000 [Mycena rosella]